MSSNDIDPTQPGRVSSKAVRAVIAAVAVAAVAVIVWLATTWEAMPEPTSTVGAAESLRGWLALAAVVCTAVATGLLAWFARRAPEGVEGVGGIISSSPTLALGGPQHGCRWFCTRGRSMFALALNSQAESMEACSRVLLFGACCRSRIASRAKRRLSRAAPASSLRGRSLGRRRNQRQRPENCKSTSLRLDTVQSRQRRR